MVSGLSQAKERAIKSSNPRSMTKISIADSGRGSGTTTSVLYVNIGEKTKGYATYKAAEESLQV